MDVMKTANLTERTPSEPKKARSSKGAGAETGHIPADQYRLDILKGVAEALAEVVKGDTEVIVHDLRNPETSIVKIVNGHISNRHEGQPIIAGLLGDQAFDVAIKEISSDAPNSVHIVKGYKTHAQDGRTFESSSVILFDEDAAPCAALCVNVDPTAVNQIQRALDGLLKTPGFPSSDVGGSEGTVEELVSDIIDGALASFDAPVSRLSKQEKVEAVATMHERGLFMLRGSAELVAKKLGTTKFSIYNYLEEIGKNR